MSHSYLVSVTWVSPRLVPKTVNSRPRPWGPRPRQWGPRPRQWGPRPRSRHQVRDSSRQFKTSEMHIGPKSRNNFSQLLKSTTKVKSLKSADHLNCIYYREIKYFSHSEIF